MKKTVMLKKNYEFKKVLTKGSYYSGKCIEAFIINGQKEKNNFLGIAVGVKLAKAVKRNKIKRLIRENYRMLEDKLNTGNYIVFLWKKRTEIKEATFENIKNDMEKILTKSNILNTGHVIREE